MVVVILFEHAGSISIIKSTTKLFKKEFSFFFKSTDENNLNLYYYLTAICNYFNYTHD